MRPLRLAAATAAAALSAASLAGAQTPGSADAALLQRSQCGAALPRHQAMLFGTVRTPAMVPRGGVMVAALWSEEVLTRQGGETLLRASVDTTAADGTFALCGVPRETAIMVRADGEGERSGELTIALGNEPLAERDLVISGREPVATVTGRILGPNGLALRGTIDVPGDSLTPALTDSTGTFRLAGVPHRSTQLRVRAVGHLPHFVDVAPDGPMVELGDVVMPDRVQELDRMLIAASFMERERRAFEERKNSLNGVFLDSAYLSRLSIRSVNNLRMASPMLRGTSDRDGDVIRFRHFGTNGECFPLVFLDGVNIGRQGAALNSLAPGGLPGNEMTTLLQQALRMEFYAASFAPAEFADFAGCGAVVLWLR